MPRRVPYALTFVGLIGGLLVILFAPFGNNIVNLLVGGGLLGAAIGAVAVLIARHSGPDERRPDF